MINCSMSCIVAFALLGSMLYMLFSCNQNDKILYFLSLLDEKQQKIYKNIMQERLNIYLQGWVLGLILGFIYLKYYSKNSQSTYCAFVAIVLGATYAHYTLMPKSTYMLEHIDTPEQSKAWLGIYKEMKYKTHMGMLLGVIALPFVCRVFVL
jgi:hypothetical protein